MGQSQCGMRGERFVERSQLRRSRVRRIDKGKQPAYYGRYCDNDAGPEAHAQPQRGNWRDLPTSAVAHRPAYVAPEFRNFVHLSRRPDRFWMLKADARFSEPEHRKDSHRDKISQPVRELKNGRSGKLPNLTKLEPSYPNLVDGPAPGHNSACDFDGRQVQFESQAPWRLGGHVVQAFDS